VVDRAGKRKVPIGLPGFDRQSGEVTTPGCNSGYEQDKNTCIKRLCHANPTHDLMITPILRWNGFKGKDY